MIIALGWTCWLAAAVALPSPAAEHPNIILVLADDLGWTGLGCYGSAFYETPHIDQLASEGVRFTAAYSAAANCAPSRASIMSGQYTPKHRVLYVGPGDYQEKWKATKGDSSRFRMLQPLGETELPRGVQTLAENLKQAGYRTGMFDKWSRFRPQQGALNLALGATPLVRSKDS